MECVIVRYEETRDVIVEDGRRLGPTNQKLWIDEATHIFTLGGPKDYAPESQEIGVSGTTWENPLEVIFEKV